MKRLFSVALILFGLTVFSGRAFATSELDVTTTSSNGESLSNQFISDSNVSFMPGGGSAIAIPGGTSQAYGYANSGNPQMGVAASSLGDNNGRTNGSSYAAISNGFTVSSGSSGLSDGDTLDLTLNLRWDGTVGSYAYSGGSSYLNVVSYFQAWDTNADRNVATFSSSARLPNGNGSSYALCEWNYQTNMMPYTYHTESSQGGSILSYNVDTGNLTLDFEAIVGRSYGVNTYLQASSQAQGDSYAYSDFLHTFQSDITSPDGAQICWDYPADNTNKVPEPSTIMLLGTGLIGLGSLRKKFLG